MDCKAKKFQDRMKFNPKYAGAAMGEGGVAPGVRGKSAGEVAMGNMTKPLTASKSRYSQSKGGNGGK